MRKLATAVLIGTLCLCLQPAIAATAAQAKQQEKMKTCSATAGQKELKGDERKAFMKNCLSATPAADQGAGNKQQQKMKQCNAEAAGKTLAGDARKAFMKQCLSSGADHPAG